MIKKRVCVIENDPDISDVIHDILVIEGFEVVNFASSITFLGAIDSIGKIDFILSDHFFATQTGIDLCLELKRRKRFQDIPFILMSARKVLKAEISDHKNCHLLPKPFTMEALLQLMK